MLESCLCAPACLPQLTGLEALAIVDLGQRQDMMERDDQSAATLQAALPELAGQLTLLALPDIFLESEPLAGRAALMACSRLQALFVMADAQAPIQALPVGPALPSLRYLTGPLGLLTKSLEALQAATQLQFVGAVCFRSELPVFHVLLSWAARHPTLRHLALQGAEADLDKHFHRIADAQRHNPSLRITRHHLPYSLQSDHSQLLTECGFDAFYHHSDP